LLANGGADLGRLRRDHARGNKQNGEKRFLQILTFQKKKKGSSATAGEVAAPQREGSESSANGSEKKEGVSAFSLHGSRVDQLFIASVMKGRN